MDKHFFKGGVQRLLALINNKGAWSKSGSKSYWITPCIDGNRNFDIFIENQGFFNYSNSSCARYKNEVMGPFLRDIHFDKGNGTTLEFFFLKIQIHHLVLGM